MQAAKVRNLDDRSDTRGLPNGSGANADWGSDDRHMPRFVHIEELFKGRHFDQEIVVLCVRW
jgi:hypothetical protein